MRRNLSPFFMAFALTVLLAGCKTAEDFYGSGPITLSPKIQKFVKKYLDDPSAVVAVREDGAYAYARYCPGAACDGRHFSISIDGCESKGGKCWIYAMEGSKVWRGSTTVAEQDGASIELPKELLDIFENAKYVLGKKCVSKFKLHFKRTLASKFAVFTYSNKSLGSAYACSSREGKILEETKTRALEGCERTRANYWRLAETPCEIFAVGRKVFWKGTADQIKRAKSIPDSNLCSLALNANFSPPKWENRLVSFYFVNEARRRGHTLSKCIDLSKATR